MHIGRVAALTAAAASLAACDLAFDPGPPPPSTGQIFAFDMAPVRPALAVCADFDAAFSLDHVVTVTVAGDRASVKATGTSAGSPGAASPADGLNMDLPRIVPGLYRNDTTRGNLRMVVAFDTQNQTKTLVISETINGCRWFGETRGPDKMGRGYQRYMPGVEWWQYGDQPFAPGSNDSVPR